MHYPLFFLLSNLLLFFYFLPLNCIADNNCLEEGEFLITLDANNTRISQGGIFELGFFTPDGSSDKRSKYVGIWYYNETNPRIVVWVANRDKPILETNVSLVIRDGAAWILGENGATYWSTNTNLSTKKERKLTTSMKVKRVSINPNPTNGTCPPGSSKRESRVSLCLKDGGDLILYDRNQKHQKLWNMFDDNNLKTDTFLPGMGLDGSLLNLTSWKFSNNPAQGMFTVQQSPEDTKKLLITSREELHSDYYWQSEATPFDDPVPPQVLDLLNPTSCDYNTTTRLVMNFTGQVQLWTGESGKGWILVWGEPRDKCDIDKICGNFASCNSNNGRLCKCLPGFRPVLPEKWDSKIFSAGCEANSESYSPAKRNDSENDSFLTLPMMKVGKPDYNKSHEENSCKSECLLDSTCLAYSCGVGGCESQKKCMKWTNTLIYIEEGYNKGITLFVRTTKSYIEPTPRSCEPCGTYIIPYPLTTGKDCGDVSYSYFDCNQSTGQLRFLAHGGTFNVTSIDPDGKRFYIQAKDPKRCDNGFKDSLVSSHNAKSKPPPFVVKNCSIVQEQSFDDIEQSLVEVEMNWKPPSEPPCNQSSDCLAWLHTTCKDAKGGQRRCLCRSKYHWDNSLLKCTKKPFPPKDVIAFVAAALLVILLGGIFLIYYCIQKRKITRKQDFAGFDEFKVEDVEGIDVPFFDWESILVATNNFADEHKLGKGGFGCVYKGTLPDGREVAVKRLLNVSLQGIEEFRTEVVLIAKLQHRNLVRLLGYCAKSDEKILLYEFMSNGSLDSCVFDETHSVFLDWEKRFDIIIGIARGLLYLHEDSRLRIIHRDLKPSNILLDEELNAKISDFEIARIIGGKETEGSTKIVVGTYGYMSPEYAYGGVFSIKSDVFSFGVVVLETISGRRNFRSFEIEFGTSLPGQAWKLWKEDRGLDIMDKTIQETCKQFQVLKCIHVGLLCVQEEPSDRPTMSAVVLMLSSDNPSLPTPKQPAFSSKKPPPTTASSSAVPNPSYDDMITMSTEGR